MPQSNTNLKDLLKTELDSRYALTPSDGWLTTFLSTISRPPPLPALTSTAHFRLIQTDITASLIARPTALLPSTIGDVQVKNNVLQSDMVVQVLEIIDTSTSKYSQIEAIERVERGEEIRGREVIRNVSTNDDGTDDDGGPRQNAYGRPSGNNTLANRAGKKGTTGPHKLLLQDIAGTRIWGFELSRIEKITIINTNPNSTEGAGQSQVEGTQIGCKLLLKKGTIVRRGMVMLSPSNVNVMGGKIEAWDDKWRTGRKPRLQQELETENVT